MTFIGQMDDGAEYATDGNRVYQLVPGKERRRAVAIEPEREARVRSMMSARRAAAAGEAPTEAQQEPSFLGDMGRVLGRAASQTVGAAGRVAEAVGMERVGGAVREAADSAADFYAEGLSPQQRAAESERYVEDGHLNPDALSVRKIAGDVVGSLPSVALGAGGAGIGARLAMKAGMSAAAGGAVGGATSEGAVSGVMSAGQVAEIIERVPEETIVNAEPYQRAYHSLSPDMPDADRRRQAREIVKRQAMQDAGFATAITTALLGAVPGYSLGKILGGGGGKTAAGSALKQAGIEATQEVLQSPTEQINQNAAIREYADPSQDPYADVAESIVGGALAGGVVGGGMGFAGHQPRPVDSALIEEGNRALRGPAAPETFGGAGVEVAEVAPEAVELAPPPAPRSELDAAIQELDALLEEQAGMPGSNLDVSDGGLLESIEAAPAPAGEPPPPFDPGAPLAGGLGVTPFDVEQIDAAPPPRPQRALPPPSILVDREGNAQPAASVDAARRARAAQSEQDAIDMERSADEAEKAGDVERAMYLRKLAAGYPDEITDQARAEASRNARLPEGLKDPRLAREFYRQHLNGMAGEIMKGQNRNVQVNDDGDVVRRLPSQNPQWFQHLGLTVAQVQHATKKALDGKPLGAREARAVAGMLDEIQAGRTADVELAFARERRDVASGMRRQAALGLPPVDAYNEAAAGELFDDADYDQDWDGETRALFELHQEAAAIDAEAADNILESGLDDYAAARRFAEIIHGREAGQGAEEGRGEQGERAPAEEAGEAEAGAEKGVGVPPREEAPAAVSLSDFRARKKELEEISKAMAESDREEMLLRLEEIEEAHAAGEITEEAAREAVSLIEAAAKGDMDVDDALMAVDKLLRAAAPPAKKGGSVEAVADDPLLASYSTEDLKKRADAEKAAEKATADGEAKVAADEARGSFALSGSDRETDQATARGQSGLFDAPTQRPSVDAAAHEAATSPKNDLPKPSEAQKKAGNYTLGHTRISGLDISIENPAGSTRSGTSRDGKAWSVTMRDHYGYVRGTEGADGDHLDVFVKPGTPGNWNGTVFVVDQKKPGNGHWDEHKAMLGWSSISGARVGYVRNYSKGWDGIRAITPMKMDDFKVWLMKGDTTKPAAPASPPAEPNTPAETPADAGVSASVPSKIDDVGEKIGGARKDTSTTTGPRVAKPEAEGEPAPPWRKRFAVTQIAKSMKPDEEGRWAIYDSRSQDRLGQPRRIGDTYATKEEADAIVPLAAVALKHTAIPGDSKNADGSRKYEIWRTVTDRKRVKVIDREFDTRLEAMQYMADHAAEILDVRTTFGEETLPRPDNVVRTGPKRRTGNVKGQDFRNTFGFRGVEFGNWEAQEERQTVMNHAFDALLDLADVMGVPAKAIGLNGELALAFGARGQGLVGARAHYERNYGVINLTKMSGAGALGHEWFHALDHYFGRQDGKSKRERIVNGRGDKVFPTRASAEDDYASGGFRATDSEVREELRAVYKRLIETMYRKAEQYVEDTQKADKFVGQTREDLRGKLQALRKDLSEQKDVTYWKRNNKPATAEQLAEFDAIADSLIQGEALGVEMRAPTGGTKRRSLIGGYRMSNDTVDKLSAIYKAVRGRAGFDSTNRGGVMDDIVNAMRRYQQRLEMLASAQQGEPKTKQVPTSFAMEAKSLDQGRTGDYWSVPHEMAARAFQSFLEDRIADRGGQSDFLSYGTNYVLPTPWGWKRPYPEGKEREAINKAFDEFVATLKTRETDAGIALYTTGGHAVFSRFGSLEGEFKSAKQAFEDASELMGITLDDVAVEEVSEPDRLDRPAYFSLETRTIYVNAPAIKGRSAAAQYVAEEILHAVDAIGPDRTISAGSMLLDARFGKVTNEVRAHYDARGDLRWWLEYPLAYNFGNARIQAELFARLGVLYFGDPEAMQRHLPKAYEVFHETFGFRILDPVSGERVLRQVRGARTSAGREVLRRPLGLGDTGRPPEGGDRGKRTGHGLAGLRERAFRALRARRGGTPIQGDSLESRPPPAGQTDTSAEARPSAGLSVSEVEKAIGSAVLGVNSAVGLQVRVVASGTDLPPAARTNRRVHGVLAPDGVVYLVADNIPDARAARITFAHEVIGHVGIEQVIEDWPSVVERVRWLVRSGNARAKEIDASLQKRYPGADPATYAREFIALAAERKHAGPLAGLMSRIRAAVRKFLEKIGLAGIMPDAEIDLWLANSEKYLRTGKGGRERVSPSAMSFSQQDEREPYRWDVERSANGPVFQNDDVALFPDDTHAPAGWGGAKGYIVLDQETGQKIAEMIVSLDGDWVSEIHWIRATKERSGAGERAVRSIVANSNRPVRVTSILDAARGFWDKMGAHDYDEASNARLSWETYAAPAGNGRVVQGAAEEAGARGSEAADGRAEGEEGGGEEVRRPLYSNPPSVEDKVEPAAIARAKARLTPMLDELRYQAQDKFHFLKLAQHEATAERGIPELPETEDAYLAELRYHGMAGAAIEDFQRDHVDPLLAAVQAAGLSTADIDEFLHARHAPEANAQLKRINPDRKGNDALSGMSNEESAAVIERARAAGKLYALEDIGRRADAITAARRNLLVQSGLETRETVSQWEQTYSHYVPLHREGKGDRLPRKGKGFDTRGKEKRRTGSTRAVEHVLAHLVAQHEATIIRAEKAKVGRALLEFARNNPNPELLEVDKVEYRPSFDSDGMVTYRAEPGFVLADNVLVVRIDGTDHRVTFNDSNPEALRIAAAMKNLGGGDAGAIVNVLTRMTRFLAIVNTSANPEFLISNFARDLQTAGYNLAGTDADSLKWRIIKDVGKAWAGIRAHQKGNPGVWADRFEEFRKAGAQTGWIEQYKDIKDRERALVKKVREMDGSAWSRVKGGLDAAWQFIDHHNTAVENSIRLSTFVHARESGMSEAKAAKLAKELTVNFNRRGAMGQTLNAMYLFYNAAIQGSARIFQAMATSKKVRRLAVATVIGAAILDILNRAIGDDDEPNPYDSEAMRFVKERNLVIMLSDGEYLKIPLPWGYNVLHVIGQSIGEAATRPDFSAGAAAARVAAAAMNAFNPIGGSDSLLQMISPTITDPLVQWQENEDWAGRPLRPAGNPFGVDKPDSQKYWNSVRPYSKWVTDTLNTLTGGDEVRPGAIDISPEAVDLVIDTVTGGAGRFVADAFVAPWKSLKGEEVETYEIPMVRKVYGTPGMSQTTGDYYKARDAIAITDAQLKHYLDEPEKVVRIRAKYAFELRLLPQMKLAEKQLRAIRKSKKQATRPEQVRALDERAKAVMDRFNRLYYRSMKARGGSAEVEARAAG